MGYLPRELSARWVVYRLYLLRHDEPVYVGRCKGSNFPARPYTHKFEWDGLEFMIFGTEAEAVEEEARVIHESHPKYNKICPWHPELTEETASATV